MGEGDRVRDEERVWGLETMWGTESKSRLCSPPPPHQIRDVGIQAYLATVCLNPGSPVEAVCGYSKKRFAHAQRHSFLTHIHPCSLWTESRCFRTVWLAESQQGILYPFLGFSHSAFYPEHMLRGTLSSHISVLVLFGPRVSANGVYVLQWGDRHRGLFKVTFP